jgi:transcriptional regulator with XRE-family HTH domain
MATKSKRSGVAKRLWEIRKRTGKTQPEFAEMVGVSPTLIAQMETGRAPVTDETIAKVARATGECPYLLKYGTSRERNFIPFHEEADCLTAASSGNIAFEFMAHRAIEAVLEWRAK